ncbi:hypothetical protein Dimus_006755 [Dionaea muscipula]
MLYLKPLNIIILNRSPFCSFALLGDRKPRISLQWSENDGRRVKYQKVKMPLAVWSAVAIGIFVPVYAVIFQQKKTASG